MNEVSLHHATFLCMVTPPLPDAVPRARTPLFCPLQVNMCKNMHAKFVCARVEKHLQLTVHMNERCEDRAAREPVFAEVEVGTPRTRSSQETSDIGIYKMVSIHGVIPAWRAHACICTPDASETLPARCGQLTGVPL